MALVSFPAALGHFDLARLNFVWEGAKFVGQQVTDVVVHLEPKHAGGKEGSRSCHNIRTAQVWMRHCNAGVDWRLKVGIVVQRMMCSVCWGWGSGISGMEFQKAGRRREVSLFGDFHANVGAGRLARGLARLLVSPRLASPRLARDLARSCPASSLHLRIYATNVNKPHKQPLLTRACQPHTTFSFLPVTCTTFAASFFYDHTPFSLTCITASKWSMAKSAQLPCPIQPRPQNGHLCCSRLLSPDHGQRITVAVSAPP